MTRNATVTLFVIHVQSISIVIDLITSWNRNEKRDSREVSTDINIERVNIDVMNPNNERKSRDTQQGDNNRITRKNQNSSYISKNVANDTETRQDQDINLRVSKEPEEVLIQDIVTTIVSVIEGAIIVNVQQDEQQTNG